MKILNERFSKVVIWIGVGLFVVGIILFLWNDFSFTLRDKINGTKFSQFSDYVGGLIGSLWALAGVILFYVALTEQREDIKTNRDVLTTQVKALEQQIKEFELQREEMEMTREVFKEQSKTLKKQQFESTFFNSLNLFNNIIENLDFTETGNTINYSYKARECFKYFYDSLIYAYDRIKEDYYKQVLNNNLPSDNIEERIVKESYNNMFVRYQSHLGHYFRTIYTIIKFVKENAPENPKYYSNIIRAQLSTYEHLLLFYNCFSKYGEEKFKPLIIEYSLLDNMPIDELLYQEHKSFYPDPAYE